MTPFLFFSSRSGKIFPLYHYLILPVFFFLFFFLFVCTFCKVQRARKEDCFPVLRWFALRSVLSAISSPFDMVWDFVTKLYV